MTFILADLADATTGLISQILTLASFLLLVYVLLDLARNFMSPVPALLITFHEGLAKLWEPVLSPIRRALPAMGGLDFSPIIVLLLLQFIARAIA